MSSAPLAGTRGVLSCRATCGTGQLTSPNHQRRNPATRVLRGTWKSRSRPLPSTTRTSNPITTCFARSHLRSSAEVTRIVDQRPVELLLVFHLRASLYPIPNPVRSRHLSPPTLPGPPITTPSCLPPLYQEPVGARAIVMSCASSILHCLLPPALVYGPLSVPS